MLDDDFLFFLLLLSTFPVIAIVALVLALVQRGRLKRLESRILQLEDTLAQTSPRMSPSHFEAPASRAQENLPEPDRSKTPDQEGISRPGFAMPTPPPLPFGGEKRAGQPPQRHGAAFEYSETVGTIPPADIPRPGLRERLGGFEERIGARWTVWVGGLALALGGVFLVRFAVEQNLLGPAARVSLGLLLAAILLIAGEMLRRNEMRRMAQARPEHPYETAGFENAPTAPAGEAGQIRDERGTRRNGPHAAGISAQPEDPGLSLPVATRAMPSVPAMLTAAGTMTAFGSIYAAYELYALISPALAFILLALTGIATVFAALLHGPALAALGFIGAALTPLLIESQDPNAFGVAILIVAVGASALAVARARYWHWLAQLGIAGMAAWGFLLLFFEVPQAVPATGMLALALLGLTALLLTPGLLWGPAPARRALDRLSTIAAALALLLSATAAVQGQIETASLTFFILTALGALALAWRAPAISLAALAVAIAAPIPLTEWVLAPPGASALAPSGLLEGVVSEPSRYVLGGFLTYGLAMGGLIYLLGLFRIIRGARGRVSVIWAAAATTGPILLMLAAYMRLTSAIQYFLDGFGPMARLEASPPFALTALGLGLLFTWSAERGLRHARTGAAAVFAAGAVVSLALALAFALEKGWLTVGLALAALGVAWVSTQRPLPGLRQLSAGLGLVVLARIWWAPAIAGIDPGPTPIFNWLLWGYGVPALAFAAAAHLLGRTRDDTSRKLLECLALLFALLLVAFEVRHLAHGGLALDDLDAVTSTSLFESGLMTTLYGAMAVGLVRLAERTGRRLHFIFSLVVGAIAGISALGGLLAVNPFMLNENVGGLFINDLLIAYGLPAVLALLFARHLPAPLGAVRLAAQGLALVLALAWLSTQVSRLFQGPVLNPDTISATEWYVWSAVWLGFGIALLLAGLWRNSRGLRLASALVTGATVAKVFLSDMADLEGALRAFSFIGLGLVLVAMGWLYQRLLTRKPEPTEPPAA